MKAIKTSFTTSGYSLYIKAALLGVITGAVSIIVLLLLFGIVLLFSNTLPHEILIWVNIAIYGVGSYIAGYIGARITRYNALFTGMIIGIAMLIILLSAGLISGYKLSYIALVKFAVVMLFSIAGAIIGVNKKEKLHIK